MGVLAWLAEARPTCHWATFWAEGLSAFVPYAVLPPPPVYSMYPSAQAAGNVAPAPPPRPRSNFNTMPLPQPHGNAALGHTRTASQPSYPTSFQACARAMRVWPKATRAHGLGCRLRFACIIFLSSFWSSFNEHGVVSFTVHAGEVTHAGCTAVLFVLRVTTRTTRASAGQAWISLQACRTRSPPCTSAIDRSLRRGRECNTIEAFSLRYFQIWQWFLNSESLLRKLRWPFQFLKRWSR
jgi:hypothetical protein